MVEFILLFSAGCLITLSLAPFHLWALALLAMAALHTAWQTASPRQALWRGFAFALGLQLSGNFWIYVSIHDHGGASMFLASIMTLGLCAFLASWVMPLGYCYVRFIRNKPFGDTLGFAAIWILSEWLKTWLLTGFPWLFLGYSQLNAPLHSWAPVIGTFGISLIIAYTAAVAASTCRFRRLSLQWVPVMLLWAMPIYLSTVQWTEKKHDRAYSVALLQPDIALENKWDPAYREPIMDYLKDTTAQLSGFDIIVWPETAVPDLYHNLGDYLHEIDAIAREHNTAVIQGIASKWYMNMEPVYHNSIIAIGKGSGIYHKQRLVPFGEYVPLEEWLRGLIRFFDLPMSQFRPGPARQKPLQAHDLVIMPYICYEVVYPDFVARSAGQADVLLTVSNDAWFGTSIGPIQHMQMAQMRALETGRYMIRDTNNGITAIIGPDGAVTASVPQFERQVLKGEVYAYRGLTPVTRYGTLPPIIMSLAILLVLWLLPAGKTENAA